MGQRLRDNKYIFFGDVLQFDARYRDPSPNWDVIGLKLMTVTKKHQGGESRTRDGEFQELAAGSVISYKSQNVLQFQLEVCLVLSLCCEFPSVC